MPTLWVHSIDLINYWHYQFPSRCRLCGFTTSTRCFRRIFTFLTFMILYTDLILTLTWILLLTRFLTCFMTWLSHDRLYVFTTFSLSITTLLLSTTNAPLCSSTARRRLSLWTLLLILTSLPQVYSPVLSFWLGIRYRTMQERTKPSRLTLTVSTMAIVYLPFIGDFSCTSTRSPIFKLNCSWCHFCRIT